MKLNYLVCFLLWCLLSVEACADFDKTQTCAACHGINGVSSNSEWPNLAGQHATYLIKQLRDYRENKSRVEPTMYAFVNSLNDRDIEDIAKYYASLQPAKCKTRPKKTTRGQEIYTRGDLSKHITACIACHGPDGTGNAQAGFPLQAGQNSYYTVMQLKAFKEKRRHNDINGIMQDISKHLSDDDMQKVADYMCRLSHK